MQGFKALNVKFDENSISSHTLFIKPHNVRDKVPEKPSDKTLFINGIPPYYNEECLEELFKSFGNVKAVYIHKSPSSQVPPKEDSKYFPTVEPIKGFKVAYVVFQKESQMNKVLQCDETLVLPKDVLCMGVQKWYKQYNERFPNKQELELEIKTFMEAFDEENNKKIQMEKELSESKDGWVTVTRKRRNPGFARKESVAKQLRKRSEGQRKRKELSDFYTFQIKESKMKNLVALRKKFEDDKRKIAALKEARRFKPF